MVSRPGDEHKVKHAFFPRRVIKYWNKLPSFVKLSTSVNNFKTNLSKHKNTNFDIPGNFWELSSEIFNRIPENNRDNYVTFMRNNPEIARRRNINTHVAME